MDKEEMSLVRRASHGEAAGRTPADWVIPLVIYLTSAATFVGLSLHGYYRFNIDKDLAEFTEAFANTLQGKFFAYTLGGRTISLFGERGYFILLFLLPLYRVFPDARLLLLAQDTIFPLGAVAVYRIARLQLPGKLLSSALAVSYLLSARQLEELIWAGFQPPYFEGVFILWSLYFLLQGCRGPYWIFVALLLLVREDTFLFVLGMAAYAFFLRRERTVGILTALWSLLWATLLFTIIKPFFCRFGFDPANDSIACRYHYLGSNMSEALKTLCLRPVYVLKYLFTERPGLKLKTLLGLFGLVGFLPLFTGASAFLIVPPLLENLLSSHRIVIELQGHYSVPVYAFLFFTCVFGARRLVGEEPLPRLLRWLRVDRAKVTVRSVLLSAFLLAAGVGGAAHYYFTDLSLRAFRMSAREREAVDGLIAVFRRDRTIAARREYLPHFMPCAGIRAITRAAIPAETDFVFVGWQDVRSPEVAKLLVESGYGIRAHGENCLLLEKGYAVEEAPVHYKHAVGDVYDILQAISLPRRTGTDVLDRTTGRMCRYASPAKHTPDYLAYGPYKTYPKGKWHCEFWMRTTDRTSEDVVARLAAFSRSERRDLVLREVKGRDFAASKDCTCFVIPFEIAEDTQMEFPVWYAGTQSLWLEKIVLRCEDFTLSDMYRCYWSRSGSEERERVADCD